MFSRFQNVGDKSDVVVVVVVLNIMKRSKPMFSSSVDNMSLNSSSRDDTLLPPQVGGKLE